MVDCHSFYSGDEWFVVTDEDASKALNDYNKSKYEGYSFLGDLGEDILYFATGKVEVPVATFEEVLNGPDNIKI